MKEKTQEEFQKDILKILESQTKSINNFKKDIEDKINDKQIKPVSDKVQDPVRINTHPGYECKVEITISRSGPQLSRDEVNRRLNQIAPVVKKIMEEFQLAEIRALMVKVYEDESTAT